MKALSVHGRRAGALGPSLAVAIAILSATSGHSLAATVHSIDGIVVDTRGDPVSGVLVAAVPANQSSDPDHTYAAAQSITSSDGTFRLSKIPSGSYGITATGGRLAAAYHDVVTVPGKEIARPLELVMTADPIVVSGTVRRFDERPATGVEIRAVRYSNLEADVFYARTDRRGGYRLALPRARYLVQAVGEGLDPDMANTSADSGGVVDFRLTRKVPPGPAPAAVVDWIRSRAIPLRTAEAGHGFEDMEPIRAIVGGAHLVSLGEATHGTREFFQLKHRMLEFLVERMGFTVFGIEATMPEGFDVNEYVLTGEGDPGRALSGLYFWTWDTQEVLEMIRWMRAYNANPAHEHKVKFYGFDMQRSSRAARVALAYLRRVDPELAAAKAPDLAPLSDPFHENALVGGTLTPSHPARMAAEEILRAFDERKQAYLSLSSPEEWSVARQHARILVQNVLLRSGAANRDRAMAENIQWILEREGPGAKMVTWAHNGHAAAEAGQGMGHDLRAALGSDMVVFGFSFNQGSFQAVEMPFGSRGLRPFTVGPAPPGSLDETLARAGHPIAALDLRKLPAGPVADWFGCRLKTRSIGAGFSDSLAGAFFLPMSPPRNYDALLFVDHTTSAIPNQRRVPRPGSAPPPPLNAAANLGFESDSTGSIPTGWIAPPAGAGAPYVADISGLRPRSGLRCARLRSAEGPRYGESFGSLYQRVDATPYRGKKVRLRASVRVEKGAKEPPDVRLWMRAGKQAAPVPTYPLLEGPEITAAEWREYEVAGEIPPDGSILDFGLALVGTGVAWLDDVTIQSAEP